MNRYLLHRKFLQTAIVLVVLIFTAATVVHAQQEDSDPRAVIEAFETNAKEIESILDQGDLDKSSSNDIRLGLEDSRAGLLSIANEADGRLAPLLEQRAALGEAPAEGETEPPEIASRRAELNEAIVKLESLKKSAQQSATRARNLFDRVTRIERVRFRETLIERAPSPLAPERIQAAASEVAGYLGAISAEIRSRMLIQGAFGSMTENLALPGILAIVALIIGIFARRWLVHRLEISAEGEISMGRRALIGLGLTLARLLLTMLALTILLGGALESGLFGPVGESLLSGLAKCVTIVIGAYALGSAYFSPHAASLRISSLDDAAAAAAHRWLLCLATVVGLDAVGGHAAETPPFGTDALSVVNFVLLALGGFLIWRFVRAAGIGGPVEVVDTEDSDDDDEIEADPLPTSRVLSNAVRFVTSLSAIFAPLLAALGFYAASRFAFYPVMFSCAAIGTCYLIFAAVRALVNGTSAGAAGSGEGASGRSTAQLQLLPVMVGFLLALAVLPVLALIWGAEAADLQTIFAQAIEGFQIGDVKIAPFDFVLFVVVFVLGYMVTRVLQGLIRRSVLPYTRMDSGAQSAILAGIGYVGVFLSALVAISATGLDLSNLAIVAGALSVGIGFGLQNIVNNFVSGIILLIERPIKTGDWVEISGVHGTVRKVNVRSTEIETFDRSTMFVPNADLISGTVTNWTHGNAHGRLIVPIGVAYGSDARQVEAILLDIARAHPMLLRRPAPYVIFAGFGADSIDFEIRGVLRDVNWILNAASDMRYEIYEKLAEAGIEIPFAQRDVTIKNIGALKGGDGARSDP